MKVPGSGKPEKVFEFTCEVSYNLVFSEAPTWDGTVVQVFKKIPLTEGLKEFFKLCDEQYLSGSDCISVDVKEGFVFYNERFVFDEELTSTADEKAENI